MSALPAGTVTFLFSDIQGSTRLWEKHADAMRLALARHDELLRQILETDGGGHVFKTVGDAFHAVFDRPQTALAAALAVQLAFQAELWPLPDGQSLRVRLALHTGDAERREGDYFGAALSRAARLLSAAHGGQTLVSETTALLLQDSLPAGTSLRTLGRHRLKDLAQPQEVFQLLHPSLPAEFPPLRSLESFSHNLPGQLTSFIGREPEMAEARRLLGQTRLLTLTGMGGEGKSRLALQVAAEAVDAYADGVWLVELASLSDPDLVPQAVAAALGIREEPDKRLVETLTDALRPKSLLLLLDNCEHLVDACARLAETLLRSCPSVSILATSREAFGIGGEAVLPLSSLSLPRGPALPPDDMLARYELVRLFVDRATAAHPAFRFSAGNAAAVSQVCSRLDGMPLALELAAARVKVLSPEQIVSRLDDRFRLLSGGSRTALPRQQTLRALIDWSYDLLPSPEQTLLRRLSVFAGGWTLDAAESVCAGGEAAERDVLDLLAHLVAKSLVVAEPPEDGQVRYRLLENLRQYAEERLAETDEAESLSRHHRDWFLQFAEDAEPNLFGPQHAPWLNRLEREHDNFRKALRGCQERPADAATFLRLAGALSHFWSVRSYLSEGRGWLETALADAPDAPPAIRAKAMNGAGVLAWSCGDFTQAATFHETDLELRREMQDGRGIARALANLGILASEKADFARARHLFEESLAVYREVGDQENVAILLNNLGSLLIDIGDFDTAGPFFSESSGDVSPAPRSTRHRGGAAQSGRLPSEAGAVRAGAGALSGQSGGAASDWGQTANRGHPDPSGLGRV